MNSGIAHCICNLRKDDPTCCYCGQPISKKRKADGSYGVWSEEPVTRPQVGSSWTTLSYDIETPADQYWTSQAYDWASKLNSDPFVVSTSAPNINLGDWFKKTYKTKDLAEPVQEDTCDDDGSEENID